MIGIPFQTIKSFEANLDRVGQLGFGHCSLYILMLEENTPFYKMYKNSPELLPSEEEVAEMYEMTAEKLS
jgi:oxygen-independent coproporphyrinogen III oxidase